MEYRDFTVITFTSNNIQKCSSKTNQIQTYNGFNCLVYSKYDKNCNTPLDCFDIAVGYDIEGIDWNEIILFIKSYIDESFDELKELEKGYFCLGT